MLKKLYSAYRRYFYWILTWTLLHSLLLLPARWLWDIAFSGLNLNFNYLDPADPGFQMHLIDFFINRAQAFPAPVVMFIIGFSLILLLDLTLIPVLSKKIRIYQHSRPSSLSILRDCPEHLLSVVWRFAVWLFIVIIMLITLLWTLLHQKPLFIFTAIILFWFFMLSWLTHSLTVLGVGKRFPFLNGFMNLISHPNSYLLATLLWFMTVLSGTLIQYLALKAAWFHSWIVTQILFLLALFTFHFGKFGWICIHALYCPLDKKRLHQTIPPVRRF
ncbi:MAG: hypothetical protein CR997_13425 [Acidobacteria bacterium]|nr:MAG: hypothetical protein CR997_13425 [Acidobacteriota bacterium]